MELVYKNCRAFQCGIGDYDQILSIYRSRPFIQGVLKDPKQTDIFEKECVEILLENNPGWVILGVEDTRSKQLISYATLFFPPGSPFGFLKLGETIPKNHAVCGYIDNGGGALFRLAVCVAESKGIFDVFWAVKQSSYMPVVRMFNEFEKDNNNERISNWLLHKIVGPDDQLTTSIEKILLGNIYFQRKYPVAIIHTSLKQEFRIKHFKKHFSVSEETLKKCTVPDYACSTSTITSLGTSS